MHCTKKSTPEGIFRRSRSPWRALAGLGGPGGQFPALTQVSNSSFRGPAILYGLHKALHAHDVQTPRKMHTCFFKSIFLEEVTGRQIKRCSKEVQAKTTKTYRSWLIMGKCAWLCKTRWRGLELRIMIPRHWGCHEHSHGD